MGIIEIRLNEKSVQQLFPKMLFAIRLIIQVGKITDP
jgi:hypothetical protein